MDKQKVVILDFGKSVKQLTARRVRDMKVYSELMAGASSLDDIKKASPIGLIFTGGTSNDYTAKERELSELGLPIMKVFGSEPADSELETFLTDRCKAAHDWNMRQYAEVLVEEIKQQVGDNKVLLALSGGVDSSVCAALLSKAIGKNLTCILVNHGLMRKNEPQEVQDAFRDKDMNFIYKDASDRFLAKLDGVTDPEKKRKIIGEEFIRVFEEEAGKIGKVDYLAQGTIYPDIIESGLINGEGLIKSHHNVGGLPENIGFKGLIEPIKLLFKDEVRALGKELGLPENIVTRQPFPGPGLGVRIIGPITKEKLDILRDADYIFRDEIAKAGLAPDISQYFVVLTDTRSTGVDRDTRTYKYTAALRAIISSDFMTAKWARIPFDVLEKVSERITTEVTDISRVVYDITSKPPSTVEWE